MAQGLEFVEYVTDQVDDSCNLTHRMMFGGCTLYLDGKVVALINPYRQIVLNMDKRIAFGK